MEEKQEVVVVVINCKSNFFFALLVLIAAASFAQDSTQVYKKRVLESSEIDFLMSYYRQDGDSAAVSGGIGTEELTDIAPTLIISIPLNDDDVLTIDASISAYTSASSSNVDPFDVRGVPDPFQASTGASESDVWSSISGSYSHSSDDRNKVWNVKTSFASEYDYTSIGFGGGHTWLLNEKNTELNLNGNVYIDFWNAIYPSELRPFANSEFTANGSLYGLSITGNTNYNPQFSEFSNEGRTSYSFGMSLSQILSKRLQGILLLDLVHQSGLLSTPFQRVYFSDVEDSYIGNFLLADDIERLPENRFKTALGGRLNYYLNERIVLRSYFRYYIDDWGLSSETVSLEVPIKVSSAFTLYPSFRYYNQSEVDYFASFNRHLSTDKFYTSDNDLSAYSASQFGFGINYTDIFTKLHISKYGLKSVDVKFNYYERNTGLRAILVAAGVKFVLDESKKKRVK